MILSQTCTLKVFLSHESNFTRCFFSHLIQTQNICYHIWVGFCLSWSSNFSYFIYCFWSWIGHKIHGRLLFSYFCYHVWISKRLIVVPLSIIIIFSNLTRILSLFFLPCKLICNLIQTLVSILGTLTSVSLSTVFFILFLCCLLAMNVHISCPVKPLIYCYHISGLEII